MGREIERKWLMAGLPDGVLISHSGVQQFYLSTEPEVRLRVHRHQDGSNYCMTVKGEGSLSRFETEQGVSKEFYEECRELVDLDPIIKDFHVYSHNNHKIEVSIVDDVLVYAEVEFKSEKEAKEFVFPWPAIEVTDNPRYKMKNYWKATRLKEQ